MASPLYLDWVYHEAIYRVVFRTSCTLISTLKANKRHIGCTSCCQIPREQQFALWVSEEIKSGACYLDQPGGESSTRRPLQAHLHAIRFILVCLLLNLFVLVSQVLELLFLIAKAMEGFIWCCGLHWFLSLHFFHYYIIR